MCRNAFYIFPEIVRIDSAIIVWGIKDGSYCYSCMVAIQGMSYFFMGKLLSKTDLWNLTRSQYINQPPKRKSLKYWTSGFFSTRDGSWTHTRLTANRILSPACLPVPPPECVWPAIAGGRKKKQITKAICFKTESERPGSNRPPRPWQGRALPNELLSRY